VTKYEKKYLSIDDKRIEMLGWVRKHRRKFAYGGAIVGGLYVAGRLAAWHVQRTRENEEAKLLEKLKKRNHFSSTESTSVHTLQSLYSSLLKSLDEHMGADHLLTLLREKPPPEEKVRLWSELKAVSFSRCLVNIIGGVYLCIMVRVQLNMLAGHLYLLELSNQSSNIRISSKVQEKFLNICTTYSTQGVERLCKHVREIVVTNLESVELNQKLSLVEVESIFNKIFQQCIENSSKENPLQNAGSYFFPEEENSLREFSSHDQTLLKQMFSDALDVVENEDTRSLIVEVCKQGLSHVLDKIAKYYSAVGKSSREPSPSTSSHNNETEDNRFSPSCSVREPMSDTTLSLSPSAVSPMSSKVEASSRSSSDSGFVSPTNISIHLAKLLPVITAQTRSSECPSDCDWLSHLTSQPGCKTLGANVYEAFSAPRDSPTEDGWSGYINALSSYF